MKISEKWLRTWVNPPVDTAELCDQLTNLGLEVEGYAPTFRHLSGVTVAKVVRVEPVAGAEGKTLALCTVSTGSDQVQVVCGAPNVRAGLLTAYAKIGATLSEKDHVKKTRMYGVESKGMLCSGAELGINADTAGILELARDIELGIDIKDALNLHDVTIDIDLSPNRGDCLSLRGIAREIGVINQLQVENASIAPVIALVTATLPVTLANPSGCPRYLGRVILNVDSSARTPDWMLQRLVGCGLRPIDPVVDVTNYVMLEIGQPQHAFDLANVSKGIVVRAAREGEKLTMLDGSEIKFDAGTLLITDGETPLAIAGVMGGERSGIQATTQDVFLECAYFSPDAIIGTPRLYGLQTDASLRYERGVDAQLQYDAIERATQLLCDIVGGTPGPLTVAESESHLPSSRSITLRKSRLEMLVGERIHDRKVEDIFTRLGLDVAAAADQWTIKVPSYRFDLTLEEDLVEEVCRVYGYNQIGVSYPHATLQFESELARTSDSAAQRSRIAERGYFEVINYSFIDKAVNDRFVPDVVAPQVENPIASQFASMRKSLIPGLISGASHNLSRQQDTVRLFEYGKCFSVENGKIHQPDRIGGLALGLNQPEGWAHAATEVDFFDVKGDLEHLLALLPGNVTFEGSDKPYLHPGQATRIVTNDSVIGDFGKVHPEVSMAMELPEATYVFELDAEPFKQSVAKLANHIAPFPSVRRDLALLLDKDLPVQALCSSIRTELAGLLTSLTVFDIYDGRNIDPIKKSVGVGLVLQDPQTTLTDEVVRSRIEALLRKLKFEFNVIQR